MGVQLEEALVRVAIVGLGAIGGAILGYAIERGHDVMAVVDSDTEKAGKTVRQILGLNNDVRVLPSLRDVDFQNVQVAVFATRSRLSQVADDMEYVLNKGVSVVGTSEELAYPAYSDRARTEMLDIAARKNGATIVGVGVNPGFVMDWVPAVVASASKNPTSIHVVRSVDVTRRRKQLQAKAGVGLTRARFDRGLAEGVLGHVGLAESLHLIALSLGREIEDLRTGVFPVLGSEDFVMGVRQFAEGRAGGCRVRLDLEMTITSADFDVIEVKGDPSLKLRFEGGVFGDSATVALAVNAIERVRRARQGLITVLELPLTR